MSNLLESTLTQKKVTFVARKHIRIRKSNPSGSNLGGVMNEAEIPENDLNNVFHAATEIEAKFGIRDYSGVYFLNTHPSVTAKGLVVYSEGTEYTGDNILMSVDPAGVGDGETFGVGQVIANKTTTPSGTFFKLGRSRTDPDALILPDLPPNRAILIWFERTIKLGAQSVENNVMKVVVDTNNIVGDFGIVEEPGTSTTAVTGDTEVNDDLSDLTNLISLENILDNLFFLGNTTSNNDASQWINNFATYLLKDIMKMVFGKLDVTTHSKRNQIVNGVDRFSNSGYQSYNRRNVNYTILDTSGYQLYTNPSTHYNRVKKALEDANRNPNIDFIIVYAGTSPYGALPDNDDNPDVRLDTKLRDTYHKLFTENNVHVVVTGGIHNYQRHHVLGYNEAAPETPGTFLTTQDPVTGGNPHYIIPIGKKGFDVGSIYINLGTGGRKPYHNIPTPKPYTAFHYLHKGVGFLRWYTTQRTEDAEPILEGRFFDYYRDPPTQSNVNPRKIKHLIDRFTITFEKEEEPPQEGEPP